jgi:hypothetical protein
MLNARISLAGVALATAALLALTARSADASEGPSFDASRVADVLDASPSQLCTDRIPISPVVLLTRSGSTLLGGLQLSTVAIYSNGLVVTSFADGPSGASGAGQALVDPGYVDDLAAELRAIGAHRMCDEPHDVLDVPLNTVSVFRGGQDARAHTFSYWVPAGDYLDVEQAITGFLLEHVFID